MQKRRAADSHMQERRLVLVVTVMRAVMVAVAVPYSSTSH